MNTMGFSPTTVNIDICENEKCNPVNKPITTCSEEPLDSECSPTMFNTKKKSIIRNKQKEYSDRLLSSVKFDEKDSLTDIKINVPSPQSPLKNSAYRKKMKSKVYDGDDTITAAERLQKALGLKQEMSEQKIEQ